MPLGAVLHPGTCQDVLFGRDLDSRSLVLKTRTLVFIYKEMLDEQRYRNKKVVAQRDTDQM